MKFEAVFALEHAGWPALLIDEDSTICRANMAAVKLFGTALENAAPRLAAIWSPDNGASPEQFLAHWERSPASNVTLRLRTKGGHDVSLPVSLCTFAKDGQKYFILQLLPDNNLAKSGNGEPAATRQKLDCTLQLARTMSLDFNNALTAIMGHASLVLSQMEPNNPWRTSLVQVEKSALRAAEIATDLADFGLQDKEERGHSASNLNQVVQRSVDQIQKTVEPELAAWTLQLERKLFAAKVDEPKVQQAFVNILQNAIESLRGSGRIVVHTHNIELTQKTQDRGVQLAAGSYVCIEFSDTGCGMEADVLPRIFEPFFTTKGDAKHRGLGLALVYGIVTNHGGGVAVSSQPGVGTSVRVYFPAERNLTNDNGLITNDLKGDQSVLLVDDEELLLTVEQTILTAYGYNVRTATTGPKALEILSQDAPVDLVITDLVMPIMNGGELVEHIQQLSPQTRIICTSGYAWSGQYDKSTYLQKPFTSQELLTKVKNVLNPVS